MKQASGWSGAIVVITLMAAYSIATAADTMYRWVDADGNVNYSDQPPPADARETKNLNKPMPISAPESESESEAAANTEPEAEFQERRKERAEAAAKASEESAAAALRKQNCDAARADLQLATNPPSGRLREQNSEGELVYMTEEQREQRKVEANDAVKQWCNG